MAEGFARCHRVDPYYRSVMAQFVLPLSFLAALPAESAERYRAIAREIAAGDHAATRQALDALARESAGRDRGLCLATAAMVACVAGDDPAALGYLERALVWAPLCGEYHHLAAILAVRREDFATAAAAWTQAVRLKPDLGPAWAALALLHGLAGCWPEAEDPARRALALGCDLGAGLVTLCLMFATLHPADAPRPVVSPFLLPGPDPVAPAALERLLRRLPPVLPDSLWPASPSAPGGGPILFVFCDTHYLTEHAWPLVWSLEELGEELGAESPGAPWAVHLHVANPTAQDHDRLAQGAARLSAVRLSWSVETVDLDRFGPAGVYYSSVRFCRLYQLVRRSGRPVLMVDADSMFHRSPTLIPGLIRAPGSPVPESALPEIAVIENPDAPPWERFPGCAFYCAPTPAALAFLGAVAFFIGQNLIARRGRWFLDQIALTLAERACAAPSASSASASASVTPPLRLHRWLAPSWLDLAHRDDAILWTVALGKDTAGRYQEAKQRLRRRYGCQG